MIQVFIVLSILSRRLARPRGGRLKETHKFSDSHFNLSGHDFLPQSFVYVDFPAHDNHFLTT